MPKPNRYAHVLRAVEATATNSKAHKPYRVLHFGVGDGVLAVQVLNEAFNKGRPNIEYYGFDLFERATPQHIKDQFLDVLPPSKATVEKLLKGKTKAKISLNPEEVPVVDLIVLGGPRSLSAIRSSFLLAKKSLHAKTVLLVDSYYQGDYTKGSAHLVDKHISLLPGLDVQVRTPFDEEKGRKTTMVWVRPAEWPLPGDQGYVLPEEFDELRDEYDLSKLKPVPPPKSPGEKMIEQIQKVEDQKVLDYINQPIPAVPKEEAVKPADVTFPPEGGGDHPDVQPDGLRGDRGPDGAAEPPADPGDAGGRREPGVEPGAVEEVPTPPADNPPVREERPEPDPVVELGTGGSPAAGDPVRGADELGREVPPPVVGTPGSGPQPGGRRSRRAGHQRPGTPPPAAGEGAG